jgi:hypothetical protein
MDEGMVAMDWMDWMAWVDEGMSGSEVEGFLTRSVGGM